MSEYEPNDSRTVHGNAEPKDGDERFAQQPEQAENAEGSDSRQQEASESPSANLSANLSDSPAGIADPQRPYDSANENGERGAQQEQSIDNDGTGERSDAQFEASELGETEAQNDPYPAQPGQQEQQSDATSDQSGYGRATSADEYRTKE